ncbi:MAG: hypothetical protein SF187_01345 [Deltaproteobacteria bacterium]|nr:hypothetical protein [Deltaproteobacteria bacterium]
MTPNHAAKRLFGGSGFTKAIASLLLLAASHVQAAEPLSGRSHRDFIDFKGPDGEIYPDFTYAGIEGGIPSDLPVVARITARTRAALEAGVQTAIKQGGGVVELPEGEITLDAPIRIEADGVVLRGAGRDKTHIVLRAGVGGKDAWNAPGIITFKGKGNIDTRALAMDVPRGAMELALSSHAFVAGDLLALEWSGPKTYLTPATQTLFGAGVYSRNIYRVVKVTGNTVTLDQPVRVGGAKSNGVVKKFGAVRRCGVEDLTVEQAIAGSFHGVAFDRTYECWLKNVKINQAGHFSVAFGNSKHGEVRDAVFDKVRDRGGNGTGYAGFWSTYDSLMDNVTTYDMRHAPNLQDQASGNVIRNSKFYNSDAQWHTNWTTENLFENLLVQTDGQVGSEQETYPKILRASQIMGSTGLQSTLHSVHGPRNVVWNCDFIVKQRGAGPIFGGLNQNWIFSYNRVDLAGQNGALLRIEDLSDGLLIRGNVFARRMNPGTEGGVFFGAGFVNGTPTANQPAQGKNIRFIDNAFIGIPVAQKYLGFDRPDVDTNNTVTPTYAMPARPKAPTASLWAWQMKTKYGLAVPTSAATVADPATDEEVTEPKVPDAPAQPEADVPTANGDAMQSSGGTTGGHDATGAQGSPRQNEQTDPTTHDDTNDQDEQEGHSRNGERVTGSCAFAATAAPDSGLLWLLIIAAGVWLKRRRPL